VDKFGNVYEGRHGRGEGSGREVLSPGVVAGHDFHHNYGSAGVALLGDATAANWPMPAASGVMWTALVGYCTFEAGRHFLRPLQAGASTATPAVSDFLRSDDLWTDKVRNFSGHRETEATVCPGDRVMPMLDDLRSAVQTNLTQSRKAGVTVSSTAREATLSAGLSLSFSWSVDEALPQGWSLAGYEYCFEGWSKASTSDDIKYLSGYDSTNAGAQPRPAWTSIEKTETTRSFPVSQAGHYTLHIRALVQQSTSPPVRSAYEGNHTYLVKSSGSSGGKKPRR
jgi:hypothetical protein